MTVNLYLLAQQSHRTPEYFYSCIVPSSHNVYDLSVGRRVFGLIVPQPLKRPLMRINKSLHVLVPLGYTIPVDYLTFSTYANTQ